MSKLKLLVGMSPSALDELGWTPQVCSSARAHNVLARPCDVKTLRCRPRLPKSSLKQSARKISTSCPFSRKRAIAHKEFDTHCAVKASTRLEHAPTIACANLSTAATPPDLLQPRPPGYNRARPHKVFVRSCGVNFCNTVGATLHKCETVASTSALCTSSLPRVQANRDNSRGCLTRGSSWRR